MGVCQPKPRDLGELREEDIRNATQFVRARSISDQDSLSPSGTYCVCEGVSVAEFNDPVEIGEAIRQADRSRQKRSAKHFKHDVDKHLSWFDKQMILNEKGEDELCKPSTATSSTAFSPRESSPQDSEDGNDESSEEDLAVLEKSNKNKVEFATSDGNKAKRHKKRYAENSVDKFKSKLFNLQKKLAEESKRLDERICNAEAELQELTGWELFDANKHYEMLCRANRDLEVLRTKVQDVLKLELDNTNMDLSEELELIHTAMLEFMACPGMTQASIIRSWKVAHDPHDERLSHPPQINVPSEPVFQSKERLEQIHNQQRGFTFPRQITDEGHVRRAAMMPTGAASSSSMGERQKSPGGKKGKKGKSFHEEREKLSARQRAEIAVFGSIYKERED